jgi:hypothetical protein
METAPATPRPLLLRLQSSVFSVFSVVQMPLNGNFTTENTENTEEKPFCCCRDAEAVARTARRAVIRSDPLFRFDPYSRLLV